MGFHPPAGQFAIRLDIDDADLRQSLALAIEDRSGVFLADAEDERVSVVLTDHADGGEPDERTVLVVAPGTSAPLAENTVLSVDPDVAVSAAHVVAAGYLVTPHSEKRGFGVPSPIQQERIAFTRREREVLELLAAGASNKLIARRLGISTHTAKFHVTAIMGKLQAHNRSEAVSAALRRGLVVL